MPARSAACLAAALLAASPAVRGEVTLGEMAYKLAGQVLKVHAADGKGRTSLGSAVVLRDGIAVTNCHVTRRASAINLVLGAVQWPVSGQQADLAHDLCLLHTGRTDMPNADLRTTALRPGDALFAVGYVAGVGPQFSRGEVTRLHDMDGGRVIQSSAAFNSGASGGGMFDEQGRLAGIIAFRLNGPAGYHYALPLSWIDTHLRPLPIRPVQPLEGGIAFWQEDDANQPWFLRAAPLEAARRWHELAALGRAWCAAEPGNPGCWVALGNGLNGEGKPGEARSACERAANLDAESAAAWTCIGVAASRSGDLKTLADARNALRRIDPRLSAWLAPATLSCDHTPQALPC